jgi:GGDEF domain-containing protein
VALAHLEVAGAWDVRDAGGTEAVGALREAVVRELKDFMDDGIAFASIGLCGFTMLLEDRHLRRALNDVRELKHAVDTLCFYWHGHPFRLSAYAGVVELGPDRAEPRRWLARAQEACAAARELGGDGVQVVEFNEHAWSDIARNREWVRHLSEIIG